MKAVLCIGGLDPSGRAGLLADARAVAALGLRPICVATALTFQSTRRLAGFEPVSPATLERQLEVVLQDEPIGAVKLGQLATAENAVVLDHLLPAVPIVLDTPLAASSGGPLFPPDQVVAAYRPLVEKAALVTPNAAEVFLLLGQPAGAGRAAAEHFARDLPAAAVLLKGGHLPGDEVEDVLFRGEAEPIRYRSPRIAGAFRGTGCRLASAIAARLAWGDELPDAIDRARRWLHGELHAAR